MRLSMLQFARLLWAYTPWGRDLDLLVTVLAVGWQESEGDTEAFNGKAPDYSVGLLQINYHGKLRAERTKKFGPPEAMKDPVKNVQAGWVIYHEAGDSLRPWGAFNTGDYRQHLPEARKAVALMARSVKSLLKLLAEINARWPNRNKASDGWIGDPAHAARHSDHNAEPDGTVDARDFTHEGTGPGQANMRVVLAALLASKDPRVSYIIFEGHIYSGRKGPSPWVKRKYSGKNGHYKHLHLSVLDEGQDNEAPWLDEENILAAISEERFKALEDAVERIKDCVEETEKVDGKSVRVDGVKLIRKLAERIANKVGA